MAFPFWLLLSFNRNSNKSIQYIVVFLFLKSIYVRLRKTTLLRIVYCHFLASCISRFVFRPWTKSNNAQKKRWTAELLGSASVQTVYIFSPFFCTFSAFFLLFYLFPALLCPFLSFFCLFTSFLPFLILFYPFYTFFNSFYLLYSALFRFCYILFTAFYFLSLYIISFISLYFLLPFILALFLLLFPYSYSCLCVPVVVI